MEGPLTVHTGLWCIAVMFDEWHESGIKEVIGPFATESEAEFYNDYEYGYVIPLRSL